MQLSGRLEDTTVGDLLAHLYRRGVSGTLIIEAQCRQHRVQFRRGYLRSIRLEGHFQPLGEALHAAGVISREHLRRSVEAIASGRELQGEALVRLGALPADQLRQALENQTRDRVSFLARFGSGRYRFEPGETGSPGLLMHPLQLVRGTPRRRGAARKTWAQPPRGFTPAGGVPHPVESPGARPAPAGRYSFRGVGTVQREAHQVLGLATGASLDDVRRAFRRLALELHPDRHPGIDDTARKNLENRFREVSSAYERLLASGTGRLR